MVRTSLEDEHGGGMVVNVQEGGRRTVNEETLSSPLNLPLLNKRRQQSKIVGDYDWKKSRRKMG